VGPAVANDRSPTVITPRDGRTASCLETCCYWLLERVGQCSLRLPLFGWSPETWKRREKFGDGWGEIGEKVGRIGKVVGFFLLGKTVQIFIQSYVT